MPINPISLERRRITEVIARLHAGFKRNDLRIGPDSSLLRVVNDLAWLASHKMDPAVFGGAWVQDRARAVRAFLSFSRVERLTNTIEMLSGTPGMELYRNHLHGLVCTPDGREPGKAADLMFELDVARRIARFVGTVSFGEPDVIVTDGYGDQFLIACKRPETMHSAVNALKSGCVQIQARGGSGCVALSLDRVCGGSIDPGCKPAWTSPSEFEAASLRVVADVVDQLRPNLQRVLPQAPYQAAGTVPSIMVGVLLQVQFIGVCLRPPSVLRQEHFDVVTNSAFPNDDLFLRALYQAPVRVEPDVPQRS